MKAFFTIVCGVVLSGCCGYAVRTLPQEERGKTVCIVHPPANQRSSLALEASADKSLRDRDVQTRLVSDSAKIDAGDLRLEYWFRKGWLFAPTVSRMKMTITDHTGEVVAFSAYRQRGGLFSVIDFWHKWRGIEWHTRRMVDKLLSE